MLVILTALPWEADRFARRLQGRRRADLGQGWVVSGARGAQEYRVVVSGPGPDRAREALAALEPGATAVLATGIAGGLISGLGASSLVLADRLLASPSSQPLEPEANLSTWVGQALAHGSIRYRAGANLSVATELTTPARKQDAAANGAIVVQMEDHAWAEAAAAAGLPFASLRAVLDPVDRAVPDAVMAWDWRGPRTTEVVAAVLRRPSLVLSLARLSWERERARRAIDGALEAIVACGRPPEPGDTM